MKPFLEALKDGFKQVKEFTDPKRIASMRNEGIRVDEEGIYTYQFGDHQEYELRIEPINEDGQYQIALYKHEILLTEKLPIWIKSDKKN